MARKKRANAPDSETRSLLLDENHAANLQVLASLSSHASRRGKKLGPFAAPQSVKDPYMNCGSHPDIVERVWDKLSRAFPGDGRCLLYGTPALVHPKSGVILAVCYGTAYCVRLPIGAARPPRQRLVEEWTEGGKTNIESEFGRFWMFGDFSRSEIAAMKEVYQQYCLP
jgi:hypothetical protein